MGGTATALLLMATTKTDICNLALSLLGDEALQIVSPDTVDTGTSKVKRQCVLHYDITLNELVRMHTWNCTKNRAQVTTELTTPEFGWDYAYDIPSGALRILSLASDDSSWGNYRFGVDWIVESAEILTNWVDPYVLYTKIPAIADMDSLFLQAFYTLLAVKLAIPLTGDRNIKNELLMEFTQVIMPEARRVNGFENGTEQPIESDWLNATVSSPSSFGNSWPPFNDSPGDYGTF